jgi:tripartite-type tricarboxylate transporter receptor subunit TctC
MTAFDRVFRHAGLAHLLFGTIMVLITILAGTLALAGSAAAYPDRPIRIIVPFAPGGGSDLLARVISGPLGQMLGQSVVVENMPGANGNIGINAAAKAEPDGHTLLVASSVIFVNPMLTKSANYDLQKDFAPLVDLGGSPNALVTRPDSGIADLADLIAKSKANPNGLNYSSPGVGSISQLGVELLKLRTGARLVHVPYTGAGPAVQAALGGTVPLASVNIAAVMPQINAGTLKALAQTGNERWPDLANVPTLQEAGVPNSASETLQILLAPARTPPDITDRLSKAVVDILKSREIRERLRVTGFAVKGTGAGELAKLISSEVLVWRDVIDKTSLKAH